MSEAAPEEAPADGVAALVVRSSPICHGGNPGAGWLRQPERHHEQYFCKQRCEQLVQQFDDAEQRGDLSCVVKRPGQWQGSIHGLRCQRARLHIYMERFRWRQHYRLGLVHGAHKPRYYHGDRQHVREHGPHGNGDAQRDGLSGSAG